MGSTLRTTKLLTISLSPRLFELVEKLSQEEDRTKSELMREALRQYVWARKWKGIQSYGELKARESGFTEEDVETLIDEMRK